MGDVVPIRGPYWDALLASIDSRDEVVRVHTRAGLEAMRPSLVRLVVAHERRRGVDERLSRLERMAHVHRVLLVDPVGDHVDAHRPSRAAAKALDAAWRSYGPVRGRDLAAWREARATALLRAAQGDASSRARADDDPERARPRLVSGGRVPGIERVARMTPAELNLLLKRFGLGHDREKMLAERVARETHRLLGRASSPSDALRERALATAERAVKQELRLEAKEAVREYELATQGWTPATVLVSKAVGDEDTCADCERFDNEERPLRDWGQDAPGGANRVCQGECRCEFEEA